METITLSKLLEALQIPCQDDRIVKGISDHSKEIQKDWVFVLRDHSEHAKEYAKEALKNGGVVLCDQELQQEHVYRVAHIEFVVGVLINRFYGDLCTALCVIGVTGTSGKTSVASYITQLLEMEEKRVLQIGTGFIKYHQLIERTHNTTPGCFQLAQWFQKALDFGCDYIVMEVSSHSIDQNRIRFINFDMILYTNITRDHLDYHLTSTHYRYTKFKLRQYLKTNGAIIYNADMPYMQELVHLANYNCICFGMDQAHFPIRKVMLSDHDIAFEVQGYPYRAPLLGMINVYNLCEALIAVHRLGTSYERLQDLVGGMKGVAGRMELIEANDFYIWLDYAHTYDALKNLLEFANLVKKGRIITLIGCGGDRDRSKRPMMADVASTYSDIAIYTSDNPRGESVYKILEDMCLHPHDNVRIFENRYFAIKHSVKIAQKDDIIIIAGKGDEDTITIRVVEYPFSDRSCIYKLLYKEELEWN
ncbi:UDP-N-acetylmuramoyl-L-alanyl-D-glutamate--2,6-diaminopimelate ligase [Amedibacillus sp. YH-ame10]